ncbi:MAG: cohesin domain-containing protein [Candidatus Sumerlaeota bacterium]|nr:cohesin domain-containing protein [Candidatus Sumerlaeota bacterium]
MSKTQLKALGLVILFMLILTPMILPYSGVLKFDPSSKTYLAGNKFDIQAKLDTGPDKVVTVKLTIGFDPTIMKPVVGTLVYNPVFTLVLNGGTIDNVKNVVTFNLGVQGAINAVSGSDVYIAKVQFEAVKDGTTALTWDKVNSSAKWVVSGTPVNIVTTYNDGSYTFHLAGWKLTGKVNGFDLPIESVANGALSLQSLSSNTFGFWYLDDAVVEPTSNTLYRARYAIKSDQTDFSKAPTFRIRYNAANFMQGDFVQVNSNDTGDASPGTTEKIYDLYFSPQYDALAPGVNGTLSFDMINIQNPTDATNATLFVDYLQLDKKAIADLGTPTVVNSGSYTFTAGQGTWSDSATLGTFTAPSYNWDNTELALTLESTDTNTFGYWQNKQDDVAIDHNVLYQLRVKAASAAGGQPTMRARMYDHPTNHVNSSFQTPVWKTYEKPPSPPTMAISQLTYHDYFAYFHNKEGVGPYLGIAIDMINLDTTAPADATIAIREVELSTFVIPTF